MCLVCCLLRDAVWLVCMIVLCLRPFACVRVWLMCLCVGFVMYCVLLYELFLVLFVCVSDCVRFVCVCFVYELWCDGVLLFVCEVCNFRLCVLCYVIMVCVVCLRFLV